MNEQQNPTSATPVQEILNPDSSNLSDTLVGTGGANVMQSAVQTPVESDPNATLPPAPTAPQDEPTPGNS